MEVDVLVQEEYVVEIDFTHLYQDHVFQELHTEAVVADLCMTGEEEVV